MKHAKRITSFLLALVMVLALGVTAFAAQQGTIEGGSITINDAVSGQTYNAYQILYIESYDSTTGAYSYKANSDWDTWLKSQTTYVSVDTQGYVTWVANTDDATVQAFAKAAQQQVSGKTPDATANASSTTVSFTNLKLGYYLIDTTLGTLCSLDTTNPSVIMYEKNNAPSNEKKVQEDKDNSWGASNDADIGQTVNFKSTVKAKKGAENYKFHDEMSDGLTLNKDSIVVKVNNAALTLNTDYTIVYDVVHKNASGEATSTCDFEITFTKTYLDSITAETEIEITYNAVLNEGAVVGTDGNPNKSWLDYGDTNHITSTPASQTVTKTWEIKVFKFTNTKGEGETTTETPLAGATFTLSKSSDGSNPIALIKKSENVYRVAKSGEENTVTAITTDATGKFEIEGLDSDTYYLTETQAPAGYNKLNSAITVKVEDSGIVKYTYKDTESTANHEIKVENKTGTELPSTGGVGTTIFYVLGSVLVIGAAVLLITKKRMNAEA